MTEILVTALLILIFGVAPILGIVAVIHDVWRSRRPRMQ